MDQPKPLPNASPPIFIMPLKILLNRMVDALASGRRLPLLQGRLELQRAICSTHHESMVVGGGFEGISDSPSLEPLATAAEMRRQVVLLLRDLTDPRKLQVRYGITVEGTGGLQSRDDLEAEMHSLSRYLYSLDRRHFGVKDHDEFLRCRDLHSIFLGNRVRYVFTGADSEFDDLILRLEEFNQQIQILLPRPAADYMDRFIFQSVVKGATQNTEQTSRYKAAAAHEAKLCFRPKLKARYEDLSKLANFSLAIQSATFAMPHQKTFGHHDFSFDAPYYMDKNRSLARFFDYPTKYQSRLVLVEWITPRGRMSFGETLDEVKLAWNILHADKPRRVMLPASIGLILDEASPHSIGLVLQLPPHIGSNLPTRPVSGRPGQQGGRVVRSAKTIAAERMPITLRDLILKREPNGIDLGIRFILAKKLLDAVNLLHLARFTHRNIRSDNILLFPTLDSNNEPDPSQLDYDNPLLVGFHDAPLEIQFAPPPDPVPWTQPEGLKPILKHPNRAKTVVVDCSRHPDQRLAPEPFRRQHDLYGVGCVLLELGLWDTLENLQGREIAARAPEAGSGSGVDKEGVWLDAEVVKKAARGLDAVMGSVYGEVTRRCLSVNPIKGDVLDFERQLASAMAEIWA